MVCIGRLKGDPLIFSNKGAIYQPGCFTCPKPVWKTDLRGSFHPRELNLACVYPLRNVYRVSAAVEGYRKPTELWPMAGVVASHPVAVEPTAQLIEDAIVWASQHGLVRLQSLLYANFYIQSLSRLTLMCTMPKWASPQSVLRHQFKPSVLYNDVSISRTPRFPVMICLTGLPKSTELMVVAACGQGKI